MRRLFVWLPGWIDPQGEASVVRGLAPFARLAEAAEIFRVEDPPPAETPEAMRLGLAPEAVRMRPGPLTVAALGADPPPRSLHFHASLLSLEGGVAGPLPALDATTVRAVTAAAARLNTRALTFVPGENVDHGLVWEGRGDLGTTPAAEVLGQAIAAHLPEGDGEPMLRRFIDDSVNLLEELPLNEMRREEGLPPINLLWPWGQGERVPVPNLALRRGAPATVFSDSLRMAGLCRLVGYRHADRHAFGRRLNLRWESLVREALGAEVAVVAFPVFDTLRAEGQLEEAEWLSREAADRFLTPLLDAEALDLTLVAGPLAARWQTERPAFGGSVPMDERALDDPRMRRLSLWEIADAALTPNL